MKQVDDQIELHLFYDYFKIGIPKRDNFKICHLEMDVPSEIKINGKLDHSLSGGMERTYMEHSFIFHLIAEVDTFSIMNAVEANTKLIPRPIKTINLMKRLY